MHFYFCWLFDRKKVLGHGEVAASLAPLWSRLTIQLATRGDMHEQVNTPLRKFYHHLMICK
jgi:hypothetical protein